MLEDGRELELTEEQVSHIIGLLVVSGFIRNDPSFLQLVIKPKKKE